MAKLKDNKIFRWIIIPICITLCFVGRFIPPIGNLGTEAIQVLLIFLGSLILWLTIGIDWPSVLCILALGFVDSLGFGTVLSKSFGNSTFIFLLFTFVCTYALSKTSIIKRITLYFISSKLAKRSGLAFSLLFLVAVLLVGLFISPSVLFVIILAILKEVFALAKINKDDKIGKALMIGLGFTVSISSGMTPIAHVFPVLAMQAANITVSTLSYMLFAIPVGLIIFALMFIVLFLIYKPDTSKLKNIDTSSLKNDLPKIGKADIITLVTFIFVVLLWIVPDLVKTLPAEFYGIMKFVFIGISLLVSAFILVTKHKKKLIENTQNHCRTSIKREIIINIIIALAIVFVWFSPNILRLIPVEIFNKISGFTTAMPPILGTLILCIARVDNKPILKVDEAFKNVPWTSLLMCAATLVLGVALTNDDIGIKLFLETTLGSSLQNIGGVALLIIFAVWAALQTNVSSNMVTATLVAGVASSVLLSMGPVLHLNTVICIIGFLASLAFATPPSMPHIAIVAGSEYCSVKDVLIFGGIMVGISLIVILGVGYPLGTLVL